jgi:glutamate/aspartate transport system substrate-binding protein
MMRGCKYLSASLGLPVVLLGMACVNAQELGSTQLGSTLQKAKDTGVFTIGHRESSVPLSYLDDSAHPVGFSVDLCRRVADAVKARVGRPDLRIEYVPVNSSNRIPLVQNGTVDIECGSTVNYLVRQQQVAFSVTTFPVQKQILAKKVSAISGIDDLRHKTVAITTGTDTLQLFNKLNTERQLDLRIIQGKDHAESFMLVDTERAVAFLDDSVLMASFRASARKPEDWIVVPGLPEIDPYALMLRKDDPSFKALVDGTVKGLMASGEFAKLYSKWFENPIPPHNLNFQAPMPDSLKALIAAPNDNARQ